MNEREEIVGAFALYALYRQLVNLQIPPVSLCVLFLIYFVQFDSFHIILVIKLIFILFYCILLG